MILTMTLNPAVDKTVEIDNFETGIVNRISSVRTDAGGKGINVSKVINSLQGKSKALGVLGGSTGNFIRSYLDQLGIEHEFHYIDLETRTNIKVIDKVRKTNTDINEPGPCLEPYDIDKVEMILRNHMDSDPIVVFSGSVPAGVDQGIYGKWIREVRERGGRTILDADGELFRLGIKEAPYLVKPNIHELEAFFNRKAETVQEVLRLGKRLIDDYGVELAVVSMGEKGALYINKESSIMARSLNVDVKSTVGAGDAMVAALAFSMENGYPFEKAITLSMAASIANVMTSGSQAAAWETIISLEKRIRFEKLC